MEPLTLVIPTFDEADTIGGVIREIPAPYRSDVIGADGGSTDGTRAKIAGLSFAGRRAHVAVTASSGNIH